MDVVYLSANRRICHSPISVNYAIRNINEASACLADQELGICLIEICEAFLRLATDHAHDTFGSPDDLKLHSSMTLSEAVPDTFPVFRQVLENFFAGAKDQQTLEILKGQ